MRVISKYCQLKGVVAGLGIVYFSPWLFVEFGMEVNWWIYGNSVQRIVVCWGDTERPYFVIW